MTQLTFLTLFLGLTLGPQPVELAVTGPAAAVELLLDGATVGRLGGPPWKGTIDFGPALLPHELVARALDREGRELGRARQWVNLPRWPAEVDLAVENDARGRPAEVRFSWQSLTGESPSAIGVTFDGRPLFPGPDRRIRLPAYDPATTHVLTVELRFSGALVARKDMAFGGDLGDEVSTDLTAVPVRLRPGRQMPPLEAMRGWFLAGGRPLSTVAVEEGPSELLIVRDDAARSRLSRMAGAGPNQQPLGLYNRRSDPFKLGPEERVRFVWPVAQVYQGTVQPAELFDASRLFEARDGDLLWLLAKMVPDETAQARPQRLADALAVSGLLTLYKNQRRALLLVLGEQPQDASQSDPALVRRYLEAIRVPLFVWTFSDVRSPVAAAWGNAEKVSSLGSIRKAFERLRDELGSQRIVWVDGRHLPSSITLSPAAAEVVELAR